MANTNHGSLLNQILFGTWDAAAMTANAVLVQSAVGMRTDARNFVQTYVQAAFACPGPSAAYEDGQESGGMVKLFGTTTLRAPSLSLPIGAVPHLDHLAKASAAQRNHPRYGVRTGGTPLRCLEALRAACAFSVCARTRNCNAGVYAASYMPQGTPNELLQAMRSPASNTDALMEVLRQIPQDFVFYDDDDE